MFELFFWLLVIYVFAKAVRIFMKYFKPALKDTVKRPRQTTTETKYKDAEEVDFIEIKDDSKTGEEKP